MNKIQQMRQLINAAKFLSDSGVCPESPRAFSHWWDLVKFSHKKGYLYIGYDKSGRLDLVAVGYRVNKVDKLTGEKLPLNEEGMTLYVPLVASNSLDKFKLLKMVHFYQSKNKVNRIAYYYRGDLSKLRQFPLRSKHE